MFIRIMIIGAIIGCCIQNDTVVKYVESILKGETDIINDKLNLKKKLTKWKNRGSFSERPMLI